MNDVGNFVVGNTCFDTARLHCWHMMPGVSLCRIVVINTAIHMSGRGERVRTSIRSASRMLSSDGGAGLRTWRVVNSDYSATTNIILPDADVRCGPGTSCALWPSVAITRAAAAGVCRPTVAMTPPRPRVTYTNILRAGQICTLLSLHVHALMPRIMETFARQPFSIRGRPSKRCRGSGERCELPQLVCLDEVRLSNAFHCFQSDEDAISENVLFLHVAVIYKYDSTLIFKFVLEWLRYFQALQSYRADRQTRIRNTSYMHVIVVWQSSQIWKTREASDRHLAENKRCG